MSYSIPNYICSEQTANYLSNELVWHQKLYLNAKLINTINNNFNINSRICYPNGVGVGIVPENALARDRDLAGLCNQEIAKNATDVYFVVSGIPMKNKLFS